MLPIAVLESVRLHDRPREVLEDENLSASLPRRLGLSDVIDTQIRRYEDAGQRGAQVPIAEVGDLLRLVQRRPDAEDILRDAGRLIARRTFRTGIAPVALLRRILPRWITTAAAKRSIRRVLRRITTDGRVALSSSPLTARVTGVITVDGDAPGAACALYEGVLQELFLLYTGHRPDPTHDQCVLRGDECCEWTGSDR